jgi:uncharacterized protein with PQ loop repeat
MVWYDPGIYVVWFSWLVNVFQALRIIKKKSAIEVSVNTYMLLFIVLLSYFTHAIIICDWVFIMSNGLGTGICLWVLILIKKYTPGFTYTNFFKAKFKKLIK